MKQQEHRKIRNRFTRRRRGTLSALCAVLLVACGLLIGAQSVSAMSCYIDAQPEDAEVGQDVTVTVVFSGDNVGRVRATLEYDTSVLSYQGDGGDTGEVSLYMASSGDGIYYSLPFKAVGEGTSTLLMTPLDAYDMDELSIDLPESQAMSVSVAAAEEPAAPAATEPEKEDPENGETPSAEPQDTPEAPEVTPEEPAEEPAERGTHATIWILTGLAVLVAVILVAVLMRRSRDED